ncbi:hypothetical protein IU501_09025 [Nocardia otitidiscaviarum]|uniref:hypothetical protein n=1 Tax=Nocardia otitidiscaviarum TaxID=1823 RepID=UPI000A8A301E|nr:hypothetical protein [Nocardia otitidiscaviarum]MBF6133141.1 hypothetical protein [Nocardia otitidiscaviarum]MBF6486537.1 hypothetical protein [Nocardia otitidiscaviarum]
MIYSIHVDVSHEEDLSFSFTVNNEDYPVPRVGEIMYFDIGGATLVLRVTEVAHWFFPEPDRRQREVIVSAEPEPVATDVARELMDPVLDKWLGEFSMLKAYSLDGE